MEGAERQARDEKREASDARTQATVAHQALEDLKQAYAVLQVGVPMRVVCLQKHLNGPFKLTKYVVIDLYVGMSPLHRLNPPDSSRGPRQPSKAKQLFR